MMTHKICKSCGENLEVSNFTKSKNVALNIYASVKLVEMNGLQKGKVLNTVAHPVNHNLKGLGIKWNVLYVARK